MQVPDYILASAGTLPSELETLMAQTITMVGEPMIVIIQQSSAVVLGAGGELVAADALQASVDHLGAHELTMRLEFSGAPDAGWSARLSTRDQLSITTPAGCLLYDGGLPAYSPWRAAAARTVRVRGGLVVITGPQGSVEDLVPAISQGRARWVRVPLDQR